MMLYRPMTFLYSSISQLIHCVIQMIHLPNIYFTKSSISVDNIIINICYTRHWPSILLHCIKINIRFITVTSLFSKLEMISLSIIVLVTRSYDFKNKIDVSNISPQIISQFLHIAWSLKAILSEFRQVVLMSMYDIQ
jgi:hypothetical protein